LLLIIDNILFPISKYIYLEHSEDTDLNLLALCHDVWIEDVRVFQICQYLFGFVDSAFPYQPSRTISLVS